METEFPLYLKTKITTDHFLSFLLLSFIYAYDGFIYTIIVCKVHVK